jgi:hypothetical protein
MEEQFVRIEPLAIFVPDPIQHMAPVTTPGAT